MEYWFYIFDSFIRIYIILEDEYELFANWGPGRFMRIYNVQQRNGPKPRFGNVFQGIRNKCWNIKKDEAGHIGYNGEKKAWKVWKKGASKRTASLDKKGNVIDE